MLQSFCLTMAVFSLITLPALAADVSHSSLPHSNAQGMSNRSPFEISNKRSHFVTPNDGIRNKNVRFPFKRADKFHMHFPFYTNAFPFYGGYGGGVYGEDDYDAAEKKIVNIIVDNKQNEASSPSEKMEKPAPPPHIVTLDQKPPKESAKRQDSVVEIRGTTVSVVKIPRG